MEQVLEQRLIRRAKLGEAAAFTELIQEHQGRLFGFLFRICGKRELCEDMVQEAFVRVLRNIERFDERYRFSTWLFTIGRRLLLNALQKNRPLSESEWVESWESPLDGQDELVQARESQAQVCELLDEAMEVLSPIQREIVLLYHHNDHAVAEISDLLGMPAGTIKSHLHRARGRMREWIKSDSKKRSRVAELLGEAA
jgi:RNA polymerase sigma-70 factor (ECF subfamily)